MVRSILAVLAGFIVMVVLVMALFVALAFSLGAEGMFQPGSFKSSSTAHVAALVVSIVGALAGGWLCALIARKRTPVLALASMMRTSKLMGSRKLSITIMKVVMIAIIYSATLLIIQ